MNIILCGMPMSGKTTIGKMLSHRLDRRWIDTDDLVEKAYKDTTGLSSSCRKIYSDMGEEYFRLLESQQIATLRDVKKSVISLGGGTLVDADNRKILQQIGNIVYLDAPVEVLWERIAAKGLPSFLKAHDAKKALLLLAEERIPLYRAAATCTIDTLRFDERQTVEQIILELVGSRVNG